MVGHIGSIIEETNKIRLLCLWDFIITHLILQWTITVSVQC